MTNNRKFAVDRRLKELMPEADDGTPRYVQLARKLASGIQSGAWKPNEALPAERELCEQLNVSRVTLRQALDAVAEQGLISRRQGDGTYVTPHIEHLLSSLISFSDTLRRKGYEPSTKWLEREIRAGTAEDVTRLGLSPNAQVAVLTRLRSADGRVIAYERSVLPVSVMPRPTAVGDSLYRWLDEQETPIVRALQYFRAANLSRKMAEQLEMNIQGGLIDRCKLRRQNDFGVKICREPMSIGGGVPRHRTGVPQAAQVGFMRTAIRR